MMVDKDETISLREYLELRITTETTILTARIDILEKKLEADISERDKNYVNMLVIIGISVTVINVIIGVLLHF